MAVDEKVIEQKIANKEALTEEETKFVMGYPAKEGAEAPKEGEEEVTFEDAEDIEGKDKGTSAKKDDKEPTAEEKKAAEDAQAAEAKKKADEEAAAKAKAAEAEAAEKKKKEAEEGIFQKVETELAKPEGQEDLTGLSEREKGLYYALKSERKKRQKAEEDRDEVLFRDVKAKKAAEAKAAADKKAAEEAAAEEIKLEGEDDDLLTVREAKKIIAAIKKAKSAPATADADEVAANNRTTALRIADMSARDVIEARVVGGQKDLPDYETTMKIGEMIIEANPEYQKQIYLAYKQGKNPALITYDLVRKDPKFPTLYDKKIEEKPADDKAKTGKENLEKIEKNEKKPVTSGKQGGGSAEGFEGYTLQQLIDMSPSQFRKVPKHIREKFLFNT